MAGEWLADTDTSPKTACRLISDQFPQFAGGKIKLLGEGWDNTAYLVADKLVFRFPRRKSATELILNEARILPGLACQLPQPIPVACFVGEPDGDYPYPFSAYEYLPGRTACSVMFEPEEREDLVRPLAAFLQQLHSIPVPADAPAESLGKTDLPRRVDLVQERVKKIAPYLGTKVFEVRASLKELSDLPPSPEDPCLVHGDLYARHLLVDKHKRVAGVIDWGDVCAGSRELDLSIAVSMLSKRSLSRFQDLYGPVSGTTWARAKFRALFYGIVLIHYGLEQNEPNLVATGDFSLSSALDM